MVNLSGVQNYKVSLQLHGNSFCTVILNCMNVIAALMKHAALLSAYWGEPERSPTLLSSMHSVNQVSVDEIIV